MARKNDGSAKRVYNRGAWTDEEDRKLAQYIEIHGAKKWRTVATKSGLNRCGKSCRLRWLNYLRPNIKRGNISDDEEDLIIRLHKLLGNRWSLIAGRLPGRTDNEIKNYWNSHLSKKSNQKAETTAISTTRDDLPQRSADMARVEKEWMERSGDMDDAAKVDKWMEGSEVEKEWIEGNGVMDDNIDVNEFLDFSNEEIYGLEWVNKFLELDEES